MQIYFSPELLNKDAQVLNIVDQNNNACGYAAIIFDEKKIYVYGNLEKTGVEADFKDLLRPYLQGIAKTNPELDIYSYLCVGGKKTDLEEG